MMSFCARCEWLVTKVTFLTFCSYILRNIIFSESDCKIVDAFKNIMFLIDGHYMRLRELTIFISQVIN